MSLNLVRAVARVENMDELHLARLLVLLRTIDRGRGKTVEGITKLAKLDFLLRYPNCLERVLKALNIDPTKAEIKPFERSSIETKMIRFRYGPWDGRYRRWIALLVGKGLVTTYVQGKTVHVGLTDSGKEISKIISNREEYRDIDRRSNLLLKSVGNFSATKLKNFVYDTFPELLNMKWGEKITI